MPFWTNLWELLYPGKPREYPDEWQLLPDLHINDDGWLEGEGVEIYKSHPSWFYSKLSTPTGAPLAVVAHASATGMGTAITMAKRRTVPRTKEDRAASWHISVEDTRIVQMISCEAGAWHAIGAIKGVGAANRTSTGVEMIGYEKGPWPAPQVAQAARVWRALVRSYGIKREHAMIPHAVIDPDRRTDPGKPWMSQHASAVLAYAFS